MTSIPHIKYLFVSVLLVVASACKKEFKTNTIVNFHLFNPVTQEGYAGVKVRIIEQEDVSGMLQVNNEYENTVIWEGITDASGKATFTFNAKKKDKYTYWQSVDDNFKLGKNIVSQPEYNPISKNIVNQYNYILSDNIILTKWIWNIACFDVNDKMRCRQKSIVESYSISDKTWSAWIPQTSGFYEGCTNYLANNYTHKQDVWDVEMEVTKNGFTTLLRDTFYITGQNGVDTLKLFY